MPESKSGALPLGDIPLSGKGGRSGGPEAPAPAGDPGRQAKNLSIFDLRLPRPVAPGKASFVWGE